MSDTPQKPPPESTANLLRSLIPGTGAVLLAGELLELDRNAAIGAVVLGAVIVAALPGPKNFRSIAWGFFAPIAAAYGWVTGEYIVILVVSLAFLAFLWERGLFGTPQASEVVDSPDPKG